MKVFALACTLGIALSAHAVETVLRLNEMRQHEPGVGSVTTLGYVSAVVPENVPAAAAEMRRLALFTVYTTAEVDAEIAKAIQKTTTETIQRHEALTTLVDQKLLDTDTRLRAEVVRAVDQLPQRVLADAAAEALKEAVLQQLRDELAQLRNDLQSQIDALRQSQDE